MIHWKKVASAFSNISNSYKISDWYDFWLSFNGRSYWWSNGFISNDFGAYVGFQRVLSWHQFYHQSENRPKGTRTWVSSIFGVTDSDVALKRLLDRTHLYRRSWTVLYLYVLWLSELSPEIISIGVIPWLKWSGWLTTLTPPNSTDQVKLSFIWLLSQNCPATNSRISPGQTSS